MTLLVALYCAAILFWTAASIWLSRRQSGFVRAHRDKVPDAFAATVPLDEHRKAADYTLARERVARWEAAVDALVSLAWALGGIGLLYGALAGLVGPSLGRSLAFLIVASAVGGLVGLPFDLYRTFKVETEFGFNRASVRTFFADRVKMAAIAAMVMIPIAALVLWTMRALSGSWWLYAWVGLLVFMMAAPSVYVRFVAPRFNRFEPLADASLRARIEATLTRSGFRSSGLFLMDASRRTAHGNAYFIGFGRTKRIVLFDTLTARSTPDEIEAVVAHELGHYVHRHVLFGLLRAAVMMFAILAAIGWLSKQAWLLPAFGLSVQDDGVALFVCLLLLSAVTPILAPLSNWMSRRNEYQADDYARRQVGAAPMASALIRLARDNASTLTPDPLYSLVRHSHPSVPLRVARLSEAA